MSGTFLRSLLRSAKFSNRDSSRALLSTDAPLPQHSAAAATSDDSHSAALDFFATQSASKVSESKASSSSSASRSNHGVRSESTAQSNLSAKKRKRSGKDEESNLLASTSNANDDGSHSADERNLSDDGDEEANGGSEMETERVNGVDAGSEGDDSESEAVDESSMTPAQRAAHRELVSRRFRKRFGIHVSGSDVPLPIRSFSELDERIFRTLAASASSSASKTQHANDDDSSEQAHVHYLLRNLTAEMPDGFGYSSLTPIQMQSFPLLCGGRDVLGIAPTGSGKTVAFGLPLFVRLAKPKSVGFRALVLSPTKELSEQIHRVLVKLGRGAKWHIHLLTKANAHNISANATAAGAKISKKRDILVSTPMRLCHLLNSSGSESSEKGSALDLSRVEYVIFDEADRLFDMGFVEQIDQILSHCTHPHLQRALFSATMNQGVEALARSTLRDPVRVVIGAKNSAVNTIKQELVFVGSEDGKLIALRQMIQRGLSLPVLLFVQSKERAKQLTHELLFDGVRVDCIHADRSAAQRTECIKKFRAGQLWMLICTDLMARGIDFKGVNTVVNYDFPQSAMTYIHRIGRTGRAGRSGNAFTFFTHADVPLLRLIASVMRYSGCDVPDWMLKLNKLGTQHGKKLQQQAPPRAPISADLSSKKKERARKKKARHDKAKENESQEVETEAPREAQNSDEDVMSEDE